jgi:predicted nucleic acid-binding protein
VPVVSNSSPLIALARIQRLDLLPAIFESVLIPPAVAREIGLSVPAVPAWLHVRAPAALVPEDVSRRRLGDGELEAIALAIELAANPIIIDDRPARRLAEASGLNVIGTHMRRVAHRGTPNCLERVSFEQLRCVPTLGSVDWRQAQFQAKWLE